MRGVEIAASFPSVRPSPRARRGRLRPVGCGEPSADIAKVSYAGFGATTKRAMVRKLGPSVRLVVPENPNPLHFLNFSAVGLNLRALRILFAGVVERDESGPGVSACFNLDLASVQAIHAKGRSSPCATSSAFTRGLDVDLGSTRRTDCYGPGSPGIGPAGEISWSSSGQGRSQPGNKRDFVTIGGD